MSDAPDEETLVVNIAEWVERAKADPEAYLERQATEVFLAALAMTKPWAHEVFLKGGILMGVVYGSPRQTGDIDFTTIANPQPGIAEELATALDANFPRAAAELGYPRLMCRTQSHKYFPKGEAFPKNEGPAVTLGSYCQIWCLRLLGHAAIWPVSVASIPSLNVTPVMTLAR